MSVSVSYIDTPFFRGVGATEHSTSLPHLYSFVACIYGIIQTSKLLRILICAVTLFLWMQALGRLAEEIAKSGIPEGSRKINGKYIHTHLVARLKGILVLTVHHPYMAHMCTSGLHCNFFLFCILIDANLLFFPS